MGYFSNSIRACLFGLKGNPVKVGSGGATVSGTKSLKTCHWPLAGKAERVG